MRERAALVAAVALAAAAHAQVLEPRQLVRQSALFSTQHPAIRGDTVSLNSSFVLAGWGMTMEEFLAVPEEEIAQWLRMHLRPGGHLDHIGAVMASGERSLIYIFVDVEGNLHPSQLWELWDPAITPEPRFTKQEVADGFALRLRVTRRVINEEFPEQKIKLGLWGTMQPHGFGFPTDLAFLKRRANLIELASLGMLDDADFLVPIVYPRFATTSIRYDRVAEYTMQALDGSAMIKRSDGSSMPLMPMASLRIYNGGQPPGFIRAEWLDRQLEVIRTSGHWLEAIAFWVGPLLTDECAIGYIDRLFSPQDWDMDCLFTEADHLHYVTGHAAGDPMADLNRDGAWDQMDMGIWEDISGRLLPFPCDRLTDCPCAPDLMDFLRFQTLFALGDIAADINGDDMLDVFDFFAFQDLVANPCP
ncbi:MAG: hypothetical protein ACF8R7_10490 [Phycisphaerales bacterium JB039]